MGWISVKEFIPVVGQPVWLCDEVRRANRYLAVFRKGGFVLVTEDPAFIVEEATHWHAVKGPRPLSKRRNKINQGS